MTIQNPFTHFLKKATDRLSTASPTKEWSLEEQKTLYVSAFTFYQQKNYALAEPLFSQLCVSNPLAESFWRGLASSLQMLSRFKEALNAWCIVALLKENDPSPHFHAAECFFLLKEKEETRKALVQAEKRLHNAEDQETLKENIALLKTMMLKGN
jgi:type III secretion system low calcium response chaperone LcrH/SycD